MKFISSVEYQSWYDREAPGTRAHIHARFYDCKENKNTKRYLSMFSVDNRGRGEYFDTLEEAELWAKQRFEEHTKRVKPQ